MTILKQILEENGLNISKLYYRAIKEWLRQKQKELPKYTHQDVTLFVVNLIKDLNSDNYD